MSDDDARDVHLLETGQIERLLARYHLAILGRCIVRAGAGEGEDVAQDVEYRLLREFRAGRRYPGVPYRVVVHNVIRWTLAEHFRGRPTDVPLADGWEQADGGFAADLLDRLWLADLIAELPRVEREACTLVYGEGLSPAQAAERLGTTANNVHQRLFHARKRLRDLIGDDG